MITFMDSLGNNNTLMRNVTSQKLVYHQSIDKFEGQVFICESLLRNAPLKLSI